MTATGAVTSLLACRRLRVGHARALLDGVDLAFAPGEAWFVLGPNGSGKSSLIHTLLGLLPRLAGEVVFAADLRDRRRLGYVPQEQRFVPPLPCTVAEFVGIGLDRRDREAARERVERALQEMGVAALRRHDVRTLSVGQRRRVLVARALARTPLLCVLDEPAANLDARAAAQLAADLELCRREQGMCLVQVAHDLALAKAHATHIALVDAGRVVSGTAAAMLGSPALLAVLAEVAP